MQMHNHKLCPPPQRNHIDKKDKFRKVVVEDKHEDAQQQRKAKIRFRSNKAQRSIQINAADDEKVSQPDSNRPPDRQVKRGVDSKQCHQTFSPQNLPPMYPKRGHGNRREEDSGKRKEERKK